MGLYTKALGNSSPKSRPMYPDPSPPTQPSAHHPDPTEPDPNCDDQLPPAPDPLLKSGAFIDVSRDAGAPSPMRMKQDVSLSPTSASSPTAVDSSVPTYVTPISQWRPSSQPEDVAERPDWLPQDWTFERKVRVSGATAGTIDRYYISPDGAKFRSKTEVLHFIQTGSRKKRYSKSNSTSVPHAAKSDRGAKKAKGSVKDFSNLNSDISNPPQSATWVPNDVSKDEWTPMVGNASVPESVTSEWNNAFARVAELEKSNGAV